MNKWEVLALEMASRYRDMRDMGPGSSMYAQVIYQYDEMSKGGDGGSLGYWPEDWPDKAVSTYQSVMGPPSCRAYNYPGYPDKYFTRVLELLNEKTWETS
jgi:hypothetical protein